MDVIQDLKKKLDLTRNGSGVYMNDENYRQIITQTQERNKEILDLISKIRAIGLQKKTVEVIILLFHLSFLLQVEKILTFNNLICLLSRKPTKPSQKLTMMN